jgi:competence protein ComEC
VKDYPVIKFTIIFIIGILSSQFIQIDFFIPLTVLIILIVLFLFSSTLSKQYLSTSASFIFMIFILTLANYYASVSTKKENLFFKNLYSEKDVHLYGTVERIDLRKDNVIQFYVDSDSIRSENFFIKDKIRFLCRLGEVTDSVENEFSTLSPGNFIEVTGDYNKGRNKRNPGEFDYNNYLHSIGVTGVISFYSEKNIVVLNSHKNFIADLIYQLRKNIDEKINEYHTSQTASLLRGLLLADRRGIDYDTKEQFVNAGVIHVLAVSGLHVGYIAIIITLLLGRFNIFIRSGLTILGLLLFVFITGGPPSVVRATIMAIVIILSLVSGRNTNLFNSLAIAALIILLFDPTEIYLPGFQLSFSAVLSIAFFYPIFKKKVDEFIHKKIPNKIFLFGAVSVSAQIGTMPFTLLYFGKLSIVALFANIIVIPAIGLILSVGIATLFFSFVPFVASVFGAANNLISNLLFWFVNYVGKLSFSHINIHQYGWIDLSIFYLFTFCTFFYLIKFKNRIARVLLFFIVIFNIILYSSITDVNLFPNNQLSIMMIDVGQGDSFLLKFSNGKTALIDAGDVNYFFDNGDRVIQPLLNTLGIDKIDYGFISHMDKDHYGGFVSLILADKIRTIYKPPFDSTSVKDSLFESFLLEEKIPIRHYKNEIIKIGNVRIYSLFNQKLAMLNNLDGNNSSGLLKIELGSSSILFTGDIESKAEHLYAKEYGNFLKSNILKSPHHGSNTSTSDDFLRFVNPKLCLISVGINNKFHHPSDETLNKLKNSKINILRSDLSSAVLLTTNGSGFREISWSDYY